VLRRPDFQGAMRLFGEVADGDGGHDSISTSTDSIAITIWPMIALHKVETWYRDIHKLARVNREAPPQRLVKPGRTGMQVRFIRKFGKLRI
jgi:hypothetical protein